MLDTLTRYLSGFKNVEFRRAVRVPLENVVDRYSSQALTNAGLVINAGGAAFPKIGAADFYAVATGVLVKLAAGTALPALTGINVAAGAFNVACFFVDSGGATTVLGGTQGVSLAAIGFPQFPRGKALVGILIITYASAFTGGTTPLDTATTVYVSPVGAFEPTVLV